MEDTNRAMDERKGHPSASQIEALELCPGRWAASKDVPKREEGDDAKSGTRIHAWLASDSDVTLTEEEQETADKCKQLANEAVEKVVGKFEDADTLFREKREWGHPYDFKPFSGKADILAIFGSRCVIVDYKTGRIPVAESAKNPQLRSLAVLACMNHAEVQEVTVIVIQPWASPRLDICEYNSENLAKAKEWLIQALRTIHDPKARRIPGLTQCKYCPVLGTCPEGGSSVTTLVERATEPGTFDGNKMKLALDHCKTAELVIKAVREEAKRRLTEDPESVPGWTLKSTGSVRKVTDVGQVYLRLHEEHDVAPDEFTANCQVTLKALEGMLTARGFKGKRRKEELDEIIDDCISETAKAPSLVASEE
ncbi:MAG: DUF2800 domain-containing protein [Phycisphaerae bacterium]